MVFLFSKTKISLFLALFFTCSTYLYATESNKIYIGVGVGGYSEGSNKVKGVPLYYEDAEWNDTKNNISFFVGYNLMENLALELEYNKGLKNTNNEHDNDLSYIPNIGLASVISSSKASYKSSSFFINVVGKQTFNQKHTPFIKFGLGYSNSTNIVDASYNVISQTSTDNYSLNAKKEENGLSYKLGLGYEFAFTKKHAILVDYNYIITPNTEISFNDSKGKNNNKKNTETYSKLTFAYKFTF